MLPILFPIEATFATSIPQSCLSLIKQAKYSKEFHINPNLRRIALRCLKSVPSEIHVVGATGTQRFQEAATIVDPTSIHAIDHKLDELENSKSCPTIGAMKTLIKSIKVIYFALSVILTLILSYSTALVFSIPFIFSGELHDTFDRIAMKCGDRLLKLTHAQQLWDSKFFE